MKDQSPRQELRDFAESGNLRQAIQGRLGSEAEDLCVDVVRRYCEPRKPSRHHKLMAAIGR